MTSRTPGVQIAAPQGLFEVFSGNSSFSTKVEQASVALDELKRKTDTLYQKMMEELERAKAQIEQLKQQSQPVLVEPPEDGRRRRRTQLQLVTSIEAKMLQVEAQLPNLEATVRGDASYSRQLSQNTFNLKMRMAYHHHSNPSSGPEPWPRQDWNNWNVY